MKLAFSFCVYGDEKKYCQGIIENLKLIQQYYTDAITFVYVYDNVPHNYQQQYKLFQNVTIITPPNPPTKFERFFVLDHDPTIDVVIIRDADSRIHERDRFCINHFLQSDWKCHTIRDHNYHNSPLMAGLWGLKRNALPHSISSLYQHFKTNVHPQIEGHHPYGYDETFLAHSVYPHILHSLIVYTFSPYRQPISPLEHTFIIPFPVVNNDFCGQVILFDENDNPIREHPFPN